jgi:hypothetical protein
VVPQVYSTIRYGGPVVSSEGFASCNASADPLYTEILALARQHNRTVTWGPGDINPWQLVTNSSAVWTNYKKNYLSTVGAAVRECGNLPLTTRSWSLTGVQGCGSCTLSFVAAACNARYATPNTAHNSHVARSAGLGGLPPSAIKEHAQARTRSVILIALLQAPRASRSTTNARRRRRDTPATLAEPKRPRRPTIIFGMHEGVGSVRHDVVVTGPSAQVHRVFGCDSDLDGCWLHCLCGRGCVGPERRLVPVRGQSVRAAGLALAALPAQWACYCRHRSRLG